MQAMSTPGGLFTCSSIFLVPILAVLSIDQRGPLSELGHGLRTTFSHTKMSVCFKR